MEALVLSIVKLLAVPAATFLAVQALKLSSAINNFSPILKQVVVFVIAAAFTWLSGKLGLQLPTDLSGWDATAFAGLLNTLAAIGAHQIWKSSTGGAP